MTSSAQERDLPPLSLKFKDELKSNDRQLINELITWWKKQHNKDLNITGRFGYNKCLLLFANDVDTFDDIIQKSHWPKKIQQLDYEIKLPRVFPPSYSLVVQQFPKNWNELETAEELKERYPSLIKLTRMYGRNNTKLNSVRVDFHTLQQVQVLLQDKVINISQMKLPVKTYYQPIRVKKCMKCFSHDHNTNYCTNQQLCIRCGQQHSLTNNCQNEIRCANCKQKHFAGHPFCPIVQQKRKQLVEQQKINRSKLLINTSNLQYQYDQADFPVPVPIFTGAPPSLPSGNYSAVLNRQSQLPQQLASQEKQTTKRNEYLEQILLSTMSNLESRISTSISSLSSQISEIETKIDRYNDQLNTLEHDVYEILIPAIQSITEIITTSRQGKKEQLTNITKSIIKMRQNREQKINHISRNTNAELSQSIFSNVDES
ncbi:unnamed protein product [Rotaria sp. Silwood1]|nr:unnamed protein product [Rotaria sp. Silwood1]